MAKPPTPMTEQEAAALFLGHLEAVESLNPFTVFHVLHLEGEYTPPQDLLLRSERVVRLIRYISEVEQWSHRVDLVAPAPLETVIERHLVDAVAAFAALVTHYPRFTLPLGGAYIDVGSGAGLPGMVWAILQPEQRTILVEPREKRVLFLKEMVRLLGLKNVEVRKSRLEDCVVNEPVSLISGRALGKEVDLFTHSAHLGGLTVLLGGERSAELSRPDVFTLPYSLPGLERPRLLIVRDVSRET